MLSTLHPREDPPACQPTLLRLPLPLFAASWLADTTLSLLPMSKPQLAAHKLIAETAVGMAHELYDLMMQDNQWWQQWQRQNPGATRKAMENRFVKRNLPLLLPQARASLAKCLQPGMAPGLSEAQKDEILEALVLDNQLVEARAAAGSRDRIRIN